MVPAVVGLGTPVITRPRVSGVRGVRGVGVVTVSAYFVAAVAVGVGSAGRVVVEVVLVLMLVLVLGLVHMVRGALGGPARCGAAAGRVAEGGVACEMRQREGNKENVDKQMSHRKVSYYTSTDLETKNERTKQEKK